jgi:hypothetical protein
MSDQSDEREDEVEGERYDAPNQQVVREDGSGPADEGTGGQPAEEADTQVSDTGVSEAPSKQGTAPPSDTSE